MKEPTLRTLALLGLMVLCHIIAFSQTRCDSIATVLAAHCDGTAEGYHNPSMDLDDLFGPQHYDPASHTMVANTSTWWFSQVTACRLIPMIVSCDSIAEAMDGFRTTFPMYATHCPAYVLSAWFSVRLRYYDDATDLWLPALDSCHIVHPAYDTAFTSCDTSCFFHILLSGYPPRDFSLCLPAWLYDVLIRDNDFSPGYTRVVYHDSLCGFPSLPVCTAPLSSHCDSITSVVYVDSIFAPVIGSNSLSIIYEALYDGSPIADAAVRSMHALCTPGLCDSFGTHTANVTGDTICQRDTATISVSASGAVHYLWATGDTTVAISVIYGGAYTVTAMDSAWCPISGWGSVLEYVIEPPMFAPQAIASDTPHTFIFDSRLQRLTGYRFEWSLDSAFAFVHTTDSFALPMQPDSAAMIWFRHIDSTTGCASMISSSIAILDSAAHILLPQIDTAPALVCAGSSVDIRIYGTQPATRYALLRDSILIDSLMGSGDSLVFHTGAVDSSAVYYIWAVDTATGGRQIDTAVYIQAFPSIGVPVFTAGDTIIYSGDTAWLCYSARVDGATSVIYSIDSGGGAHIDSLTGCVSSVTADFTVRVHARGLPSCGEQWATQHVEVNNIGPPFIPSLYPRVIEAPQVVSVTIDSIIPGANADRIEWSPDPDFKTSYILTGPAKISIDVFGPADTLIYIRSRNSSTGLVSLGKTTLIVIVPGIISAGLLDKSGWNYDPNLSDEFNSYNSANDIANASPQKWALSWCWGGQNCYPENTCSHFFTGCEAIFDYANFIDPSHLAHDGVYFDMPGVATLRATPLPAPVSFSSTYTCLDVNGKSCYYSSGALLSTGLYPVGQPGLLEIRARKTSRSYGKCLEVWLMAQGAYANMDLLEPDDRNDQSYMDLQNPPDYHDGCFYTFRKTSPCDFKDDWHTYDWLFTGAEIIFFIDGKEKFSRTVDYPADGNADMGLTCSSMSQLLIGNIPLSGGTQGIEESALIDYVRYYTRSGCGTTAGCLLNTPSGGVAKTMEDANVPVSQQPASTQLLFKNPGPSPTLAAPLQVAPWHSVAVMPGGDIAFIGLGHDLIKASTTTISPYVYRKETITGNILSPPALWARGPSDAQDWITPASDQLVYYQNTSHRLDYTFLSGGIWRKGPAMEDLSVSYPDISGHPKIPVYCTGHISLDFRSRVWHKGLGGEINVWSTTGGKVNIPADRGAPGHFVVSHTGAFFFYRDHNGDLWQSYHDVGGWHELPQRINIIRNTATGITTGAPVSDEFILDEPRARLYFVGRDNAVYYYRYDFSAINPNGLVRLGQNATESGNTVPFCIADRNAFWYDDPGQTIGLVLSSDGNTVYYHATDGLIWYYFNDKEYRLIDNKLMGPNWNKTPLTTRITLGPMALASGSGSLDRFYYVGDDLTLHMPSWVNADVPQPCPPGQVNEGLLNEYKSAGYHHVDSADISVAVFPNPSDASFNIKAEHVSLGDQLELTVTAIDGSVVYTDQEEVPDGSKHYQFIWDAEHISSGIYFCRVSIKNGQSYTVKMVKL